jgi:cell division transport system ATP-binding protein
VVEVQNLSLAYQDKPILEDISLQINRGEFVFLIGRTGAGKSSLLRLLYADLKPTKGTARVDQYHIERITEREVPYLRRRLGVVFQNFELLPDRSVGENIAFAMKATGWTDRKKIKQRLTEVLMLVGLSSKIGHYPHQLSGGEQQRTAIARALVNDPVLLIADEPTGNLDPEVTDHILEVLEKINRAGTAVLMATHNYDVLRKFPARMLKVADGKISTLAAPPQQIVY